MQWNFNELEFASHNQRNSFITNFCNNISISEEIFYYFFFILNKSTIGRSQFEKIYQVLYCECILRAKKKINVIAWFCKFTKKKKSKHYQILLCKYVCIGKILIPSQFHFSQTQDKITNSYIQEERGKEGPCYLQGVKLSCVISSRRKNTKGREGEEERGATELQVYRSEIIYPR